MTTASAQARHLSLLRLERAAGQAFGCAEDSEPTQAFTPFLMSATIVVATVATAFATLRYLV